MQLPEDYLMIAKTSPSTQIRLLLDAEASANGSDD